MKELSIEEKAKAYDRVAKEVKDFFEGKQKMYSDVTQTLEYLFPELKESEDEKIIQWIRKEHEAKYVTDNIVNSVMADKEFAWLEKQDEQEPIKCNEEWYDFVRWFVKVRTDNYTLIPSDADIRTWGDVILDHAKKELEKQGEQKPVEWSEDDEAARNDIIDKLERIRGTYVGSEREICRMEIDWFKSLKDRIQPKQEWSEEDEKAINDIMFIIESYRENGFNEIHKQMANNAEKWIKSLRPQNK